MAGYPCSLREIGLDRPLAPAEVGRALYHLAQHRGFWSAQVERPKSKEEGKEAGVVKEAVQELTQDLGEQTLGACLTDLPAGTAKRGHHLSRIMIEDEFAHFWAAHAPNHATVMTEDLRRRVASLMFFQRLPYWKMAPLGHCELEPDSHLAACSSYLGKRFLLLQDLNNLRHAGGNVRPLTLAERAAVLPPIAPGRGTGYTRRWEINRGIDHE